jgi:organic hydroperoxide reductase OsmC/OhrA
MTSKYAACFSMAYSHIRKYDNLKLNGTTAVSASQIVVLF